jgi:hypothetical protein
VSNDDRATLAEALAAEAVPPDVGPRTPAARFRFTPHSVVDVTWPGRMTFDVEGMPSGMSTPRIYRMTAGPNGILAGWLSPSKIAFT